MSESAVTAVGGAGAGSSSSNSDGVSTESNAVLASKVDASRSVGSGSDSGESSAASTSRPTSRPASQPSIGRLSVTFASPRTLVVNYPNSSRSNSSDPSTILTPGSAAGPSSPLPPSLASTAHFEHELALQRSEFEQRFVVFQQQMSVEQSQAECVSYRQQVAAMSEQLAVQELFMACQRVELAHFHEQRQRDEQQRAWQVQQPQDMACMDSSWIDSGASDVSSTHCTATSDSPASTTTTSAGWHRPSGPATPSSVLSSVSSVLDAAVSSHHSATYIPTVSPFTAQPSSSSLSPSSARPASAVTSSPRRPATAATSTRSAFASPFASSAGRSVSVLATASLPPHLSSAGVRPSVSFTPSLSSSPTQPSSDAALADVLAMTESLLAATDDSLQAEQANTSVLQSTIADMQRRAAVTSRQYDADTAEIREQLRIRAAVCTKQEEALHRLTFENHSLVQHIIQLQHQLQHTQQSQQPTHPTRPVQTSSHHLPAATSTQQSSTTRRLLGARDRGGGLFPPISSASAASSHTTAARLSKLRFVQPPPAPSLATGFCTDSSHASPISTAALGWSQGWKSYSSDDSPTTQHDESKEQLGLPWSVEKLGPNSSAVDDSPLVLIPPLPAVSGVTSESSDTDKQPQLEHEERQNAEIVISPLAMTVGQAAFVAAGTAEAHVPSSPTDSHTAAASALESSADRPTVAQLNVHTASLQLPAAPLSPEQRHLHAHFHRPPPPHDTQPPRLPSALRSRSSRVTAVERASAASDHLTLLATSFKGGPHAATLSATDNTQGVEESGQEDDGWGRHVADEQRAVLEAPAADESERGWIVEAGGAG